MVVYRKYRAGDVVIVCEWKLDENGDPLDDYPRRERELTITTETCEDDFRVEGYDFYNVIKKEV